MRKKEEEKNGREETLLQELCGADTELYACLSTHLYETPLAAISQKDLDILTEEAETTGSFRAALDKAIFEAAQNAGERERYVKTVKNLTSKSIHAMEQKKETLEKEGLTDQAASLGREIEYQELMSERTEDILSVASQFYNEKLLELGENLRRTTRGKGKKEAEREEKRIVEQEKAGREARRQTRTRMGRVERREAKKQDRAEKLAAEERKQARGKEREEAEREETRIGELEEAGREARKEERRGN
jgi:hypothetical protein